MRFYILPRVRTSMGAKYLSRYMKVKRIRLRNSRFVGSRDKLVYNMGHSFIPNNVKGSLLINSGNLVSVCADKVRTLNFLKEKGVPCVEHTTEKSEAESWLMNGSLVVCRSTTTSYGGRGISFISPEDYRSDPDMLYIGFYQMFTKYFNKDREYRIHISNDGPFYYQMKIAPKALIERVGRENINWRVQSSSNGFIFKHSNLYVPPSVRELGSRISSVFKEHFKNFQEDFIIAADVLYDESNDVCIVCEINSAPGLKNHSVEVYSARLKEIIQKVTDKYD